MVVFRSIFKEPFLLIKFLILTPIALADKLHLRMSKTQATQNHKLLFSCNSRLICKLKNDFTADDRQFSLYPILSVSKTN